MKLKLTEDILISMGERLSLDKILKSIKSDLTDRKVGKTDLLHHHDTLLNTLSRWPKNTRRIKILIREIEQKINTL